LLELECSACCHVPAPLDDHNVDCRDTHVSQSSRLWILSARTRKPPMADRVVIAVQTINGQDLAADEPPQLVLSSVRHGQNYCTTDCWINAIDGHVCKSSPSFQGLLRPRYHPTGPRTVQFSFIPDFYVVVLHNVGTSVLPGYPAFATFGVVVSYLLFAFAL